MTHVWKSFSNNKSIYLLVEEPTSGVGYNFPASPNESHTCSKSIGEFLGGVGAP